MNWVHKCVDGCLGGEFFIRDSSDCLRGMGGGILPEDDEPRRREEGAGDCDLESASGSSFLTNPDVRISLPED